MLIEQSFAASSDKSGSDSFFLCSLLFQETLYISEQGHLFTLSLSADGLSFVPRCVWDGSVFEKVGQWDKTPAFLSAVIFISSSFKAQLLPQTEHQTIKASSWGDRCSLRADVTHTYDSLFKWKPSLQLLFLIVREAHTRRVSFSHTSVYLITSDRVSQSLWTHRHPYALPLASRTRYVQTADTRGPNLISLLVCESDLCFHDGVNSTNHTESDLLNPDLGDCLNQKHIWFFAAWPQSEQSYQRSCNFQVAHLNRVWKPCGDVVKSGRDVLKSVCVKPFASPSLHSWLWLHPHTPPYRHSRRHSLSLLVIVCSRFRCLPLHMNI